MNITNKPCPAWGSRGIIYNVKCKSNDEGEKIQLNRLQVFEHGKLIERRDTYFNED